MSKAENLIKALEKKAECEVKTQDDVEDPKVAPTTLVRSPGGSYSVKEQVRKCGCCCESHHKLSFHNRTGKEILVTSCYKEEDDSMSLQLSPFFDEINDGFSHVNDSMRNFGLEKDARDNDSIYELITALETDFSLECGELYNWPEFVQIYGILALRPHSSGAVRGEYSVRLYYA